MMTMTTPRSIIKWFALFEGVVILALLYSYTAFVNAQTAVFAAALIMIGSMYSYAKFVHSRLDGGEVIASSDTIDTIEDPHDIYDDDQSQPAADVIKEEKQRLKAQRNTLGAVKTGAPAMVSLFRIIPYLFLVVGFIALKNNQMLDLRFFLPGLAVGIAAGFFIGRSLFIFNDRQGQSSMQ